MNREQRARLSELIALELDGVLDEAGAKELSDLMNLEDAVFVAEHDSGLTP